MFRCSTMPAKIQTKTLISIDRNHFLTFDVVVWSSFLRQWPRFHALCLFGGLVSGDRLFTHLHLRLVCSRWCIFSSKNWRQETYYIGAQWNQKTEAILLETVSQTKSDEFVSLGFGTVCRSSVQDQVSVQCLNSVYRTIFIKWFFGTLSWCVTTKSQMWSTQDFRTVPVEGEVRGGISKEKCQHLCSTDRTCAGLSATLKF